MKQIHSAPFLLDYSHWLSTSKIQLLDDLLGSVKTDFVEQDTVMIRGMIRKYRA